MNVVDSEGARFYRHNIALKSIGLAAARRVLRLSLIR